MSEENTYQPGWEDAKRKKHHHHHESRSKERNRGLGGALRMRDKQAYYGLMAILIIAALVGLFFLTRLVIRELKAMPNDDPATEMAVDVLRINKVGEQQALLAADSISQAYNLDSLRLHVQKETTPVYRPPRKENTWYITKREWEEIWQTFQIWRKNKKEEKE